MSTPRPPKILTLDAVKASHIVITMDCGDTCLYYPAGATKTGCSTTRGYGHRRCSSSPRQHPKSRTGAHQRPRAAVWRVCSQATRDVDEPTGETGQCQKGKCQTVRLRIPYWFKGLAALGRRQLRVSSLRCGPLRRRHPEDESADRQEDERPHQSMIKNDPDQRCRGAAADVDGWLSAARRQGRCAMASGHP